MIKREKYLEKIREFYHTDLIKIITGIRRCGKSILLKQIVEEIQESNVDDKHIIYINFEDVSFSFIHDYLDLNRYVTEKIKDKGKYYLLFDEIQMVQEWEKAVNSFKATLNVSIFVTGSNSKLLAGELATLLSGRYVSFRLAPFSFREVIELKGISNQRDIEDAFNDYLLWGGLPQRFEIQSLDGLHTYLMDVFDAIVLKDIVKRHNIKNISLFERIMEYLVTNPSQVFSPANMVKEFEKANIPVSTRTIYECLDYAEEALLMQKVSTYDIRRKRILSRKDKYYLTDEFTLDIMDTGNYLQNSDTSSASNGHSVACLFTYKDFKFFTAGDLTTSSEADLLKREDLPNITLYKASHHGSNGSNSQELLNTLNPKGVAISAARYSTSYGIAPSEKPTKNDTNLDLAKGHPYEGALERIYKTPNIMSTLDVHWNAVNGTMCYTTYGEDSYTFQGSTPLKGYYDLSKTGGRGVWNDELQDWENRVTGEENKKFHETVAFKARGYEYMVEGLI